MSQAFASETVFSLCAEYPAQSANENFDSGESLDAALLSGDAGQYACRIQRLSAAGATLQVGEMLTEGAAFMLELGHGQRIPGTVSWSNELEAGFLFDAPVDVVATLARNLAKLPAERRRIPRVELRQNVGIRHGGEFEFAKTRDLSQAGVGIEVKLKLAEDDHVQIGFDGLHPLSGTVRWASNGKAGIAFDHELSWQTLMPWLRQAQHANAHAAANLRPLADEGIPFKLGDGRAVPLNAPARVRDGARWWNVHVRALTEHLVAFDCATPLAPGTTLWLWLPGFPGWPATVSETEGEHVLAEFRMALRKHDLDRMVPSRLAAR